MSRIDGVLVCVLASGAVDCGFEPRSGQTKDYKIGICCFSGKYVVLWRKGNASSEIFQLYHGENKLIFKWNDDGVRFVLDQHA
jgi:hypothetical protein